jgi:hypothetical protein
VRFTRCAAFDSASPDGAAEARRKRRTLAGNYQILGLEPRILVPYVNPVWLQYASHKIGRLIVPWALVALLIASAALAGRQWFYTLALVAQAGFYGLAALGAWFEARERDSGAKVGALAAPARRGAPALRHAQDRPEPRRRPSESDLARVTRG